MKTPEELAEDHANMRCPEQGPEFIVWCMCKDDFLTGYQAAKDRLPPFHAGADVYIIDANNPLPKPMPLSIAEQNQFADTSKVMNSSNNSNGWISVKDRLPGSKDGVTQLWMKGCSFADLVLGCHAVMTDKGETIEGVFDMNKPDGIWDLSDFSHWMPLPKPPEE